MSRRRARYPYFGPEQTARLLADMRSARQYALLCGASAGYNTERFKKCEALQKAIDALAEDLTGDPKFYWDKPAVSQAQAKDRA